MGKLRAHVAAHAGGADVGYTDSAVQTLDDHEGPVGVAKPEAAALLTTDAAEFFIAVKETRSQTPSATEVLRRNFLLVMEGISRPREKRKWGERRSPLTSRVGFKWVSGNFTP